jgi:hypothetical protein
MRLTNRKLPPVRELPSATIAVEEIVMRKCFLLTILVFLPVLLLAQSSDEYPKVEVFGGYSYLHTGNQNFNGGLTKHFAIRPVQVDYLHTDFSAEDALATGFSNGAKTQQNSFRYSAGVVFRF